MFLRISLCMFLICALEFGQTNELSGPGTLRSLNKRVTSSSQHPDARFLVSHAVDGSTMRDSRLCSCCATTIQENDPWIQIDLGRQYRIAIVEVIGRIDYNDPFNIDIFVSTTNINWQNNPSTQPTLPDVPEKYHNVTFSYPVIGQFVTLQLSSYVLLCVCEVNIYSKDCSPGTYGLHCNETCGQCQNGETCDHVTERCTWCDSGFRGDHCKEECLPGSFGTNCSSTCHCQDNLTCDHVNGSCPDGICDFRWHGSNCSQDTLRSLNAIVRASSIHSDSKFNLSRAVDGSTSTHSTDCRCCAATNNEDMPWIQINLGRLYTVATVEVVSRTDFKAYFTGINIYLHENKDNWTLNHVLVRIIHSNGSPYYKTTLLNPVIAQYVTLQIPENNTYLVVCEVSVFSSDCRQGSYGLYCNETCGQCRNSEMCDHVTGSCEQCLPGYQYPLCKNDCLPGYFGRNCSETCHCQENLPCDQVNGSCPKGICDLGWHGSNCSQECDNMTYGNNCAEECGHCYKESCDRRTGECNPCSDGYTGPTCMEGIIPLSAAAGMQVSMSSVHAGMDATKAIDGRLVDDPEICGCCSETTIEYSSWWQVDLGRPFFLKKVIVYGRLNENIFKQLMGFSILTSLTYEFSDKPVHIQNGEIQDNKVVVLLQDVAARYMRIQRLGILTICEVELVQSDIICPTYTYGRDCTPCGPCRNGSCDPVTGDCPSGCYDGYGGNRCEKLTVHKSINNDVIHGVIGAGVGVVTSLFVVALIVALFRYKKRRIRIYEEPSVRWSKEPTKESAYATLENQEIVIKKEETYDNPM